ncbi:MAG: hypothetical protein F6J97_16410 [Leptolyngbya sp. SIO4C1]|nr:hypothetical protein [Leptolyngbya sp. SIO4C1]
MVQVKTKLRQMLYETLEAAQATPVTARQQLVRQRLQAIQTYCRRVKKTFIVVELEITCNQYELGGSSISRAVLFRGPSENASVAICVSDRGSILHRNDSDWQVYCNAGDVAPVVGEIAA